MTVGELVEALLAFDDDDQIVIADNPMGPIVLAFPEGKRSEETFPIGKLEPCKDSSGRKVVVIRSPL